MNNNGAALRQLDSVIWYIVAGVAVIVLAASLLSSFQIAWSTFAGPVAVCAALVTASILYERRRTDLRIASALGGTAQLIAFTGVAAPLSYLAASTGLPLQDHLFDMADQALGMGWRALLDWMNAQPRLHLLFWFGYISISMQLTATVLLLAFTERHAQLRIFMLAFMLTALVTIVLSGLIPAQGAWGYYGLTAADHPAIVPATQEKHLPVFLGLRDGSFRLLVAMGSEGIITFPSLHAALGVIFIFALWPMPVVRWFALGLNLLMIGATPIDGGHYFIDVIAGIAIAVPGWLAARALTMRVLAGTAMLPAERVAAKTGAIRG